LIFLISKINSKEQDRDLDAVLIDAIRWPRRNRFGKAIDNSTVLRDIITLLEDERIYNPGFPVWKQLILASSKGAPQDKSRWDLVSRVFTCLSWSKPGYCPGHVLLKHGLDASRALQDPKLASNLIWRSVYNYREPLPSSKDAPPDRRFDVAMTSVSAPNRSQVPFMDFKKAMEICMDARDMVSCRVIRTCANKAEISGHHLRALYFLNLMGFANSGEVEPAEKLIMEMHILQLEVK